MNRTSTPLRDRSFAVLFYLAAGLITAQALYGYLFTEF